MQAVYKCRSTYDKVICEERLSINECNLRDCIIKYTVIVNCKQSDFTHCFFLRCAFTGEISNSDFRTCYFNDCLFNTDKEKNNEWPDCNIPQDQDLIVYKKVYNSNYTYTTIKLLIPKDAKRTGCLNSRKCRAEYAVVLEGAEELCYSLHDIMFEYKNGATVRPKFPYDDRITQECTSGIHFFLTKEEAEIY